MRVTRRTFLASGAGAVATAQPAKPNLLLLITDQHSPTAISAHGNPYLQTPAIDSLVAGGVSFTESYCTYPVCSPARSSLFTSRMPHETGVEENGRGIAPGIATMGEVFRNAGYRTVYGGKWHVPKPFEAPPHFEQLIGGHSLGQRMDQPLASACVEFLAKKTSQPFLMVASFMNPHDICDWIRQHPGAREHVNPAAYPPAPANMAVDPDEPEAMQFHRKQGYDLMSQAVGIASQWMRNDVREYLHAYNRFVEDVDTQIARVLAALRSSGLTDSTLVVLTSDHGEGLGAHSWVQKAAFWEESAKVPFIVSGGGVRRRSVVDTKTLVSGVDLLPTLCDYAGIKEPELVRGRSLRRAIEGGDGSTPYVVSELLYGDASRTGRMLRTPRYKYVVFNSGARPEQLFDLELDPGEVRNLARSPQARVVLQDHRTFLNQWLERTQDRFKIPGLALV